MFVNRQRKWRGGVLIACYVRKVRRIVGFIDLRIAFLASS